ncbi:MAG: hypothetical protein ACRDVM_06270, partial [Acidimicrobiia bacterium]
GPVGQAPGGGEVGGMTARPLGAPATRQGLRVLLGRRAERPVVAPWLLFSMVAVVAFLGLIFTRTASDRSAFELAEIDQRIGQETIRNQQLRLEIAALESPSRVAPLAADLGMVFPSHRTRLEAERYVRDLPDADPRWVDLPQTQAAERP